MPNRTVGLCYEDFELEQTFNSAGRTLTESDLISFAALTGDWSEIHTNADYAARAHYGQRIAHGLLVLALASGQLVRLRHTEGTILAFREIQNWKFRAPVFIGDTLWVHSTVVEKRPYAKIDAGSVVFAVQVVNQDGDVVQEGRWLVLVKSRA